ncbi:MAG: glycosyltransferase family 4 protein, partial [Sphingobacteriales bacterium]
MSKHETPMVRFRKHVLHLPGWYPNRTGPQHGDFIKRHLQALSAVMPVHVIFVVKDPFLTESVERLVTRTGNLSETIIYYKPLQTGISALDRLISFHQYRRLLKKETFGYIRNHGRPDLVHIHVAMRAGIAALYLWRTFGIPFLVSEHWSGYYEADPDNYFNRNKIFRKYTQKIFRNAWRVAAVSTDLMKTLSGLFSLTSGSVIYNVVNTQLFCYRPAIDRRQFCFIHISNMDPIKNPTGILRVLARLKEVRADWKMILVGESDSGYRELVKELNIGDHVEFKGSVPHESVPGMITQADALLMFSNHETLSCVICESLCCGVPVIATRVGGIPEIVNADNGILCEPRDEDGLLRIVLEMMNDYKRFDRPAIAAAAVSLFNEAE